jgi:hypothetical protein
VFKFKVGDRVRHTFSDDLIGTVVFCEGQDTYVNWDRWKDSATQARTENLILVTPLEELL